MVSKKKKKRSSPKLRLIFRPKLEIQTFEGGLFSIFHKKSASKAPKTCDLAYFTSQWGNSSPPPPLATLLLPYQFHTRFRALYLQKNTYRCRVGIIILLQKYSTSISAHVICRQIAVLWLCILRKQCTYCITVSKLQFNCSIDVAVYNRDRFDLFCFFYFEADNLPSRKFCFLTSLQKLVFAISSPFQFNFIYIFLFFKLVAFFLMLKLGISITVNVLVDVRANLYGNH